MKAVFIGEDGSLGFKHGVEYELKSEVDRWKKWIEVSTIDDKLHCGYRNIEAFLANWDVVK